jgi:hypothetical protein
MAKLPDLGVNLIVVTAAVLFQKPDDKPTLGSPLTTNPLSNLTVVFLLVSKGSSMSIKPAPKMFAVALSPEM